jgi:hypothetical protein
MAISPAERRFLRSWEEQRNGGKTSFVAIYTFAYTLVIFLSGIALALFGNVPFVHQNWLTGMGIGSIILAFGLSHFLWYWQQKKWRAIINREMAESN